MRIVIPGGSGQVGGILRRGLVARGHDVVVLARGHRTLETGVRVRTWDAITQGGWADEIDGADAVINLAGRSVSCRYSETNLAEMLSSRVDSTRAVGAAISASSRPPRVWLQMSTATIYADSRDSANDETGGRIGGDEPDVPAYWRRSVRIAQEWEAAQQAAHCPDTRRVAMRTAMVMSPDRGGVFDVLSTMARTGLGGPVAGGGQYVSWIHDADLLRAVALLLERDDLSGPVNLAAPTPLPQADFMRILRHAWGRRAGLPATRAMAGVGAWVLRSDPELLLKSRWVVPGRLTVAGFEFDHPTWPEAASDLVRRARARPEGTNLIGSTAAMLRATA